VSEHEPKRSGGALPGLVKGLAVTARALVTPAHTAEYPDVEPSLPPRSRGVIALLEENCTVCMLCARECPDWCIYIDSHKETLPATTEGGRERQRNVLDRFDIDFSLCMYCSICVEVCPFDALHWSPEFEYSELDIRDLLHGRDRLGQWMPTVPPPPAPDAGTAEPKEVAAAQRPARPARPAGASAPGTTERPARPAGASAPGTTERPARERPPRPDRPARPARPDRPAPERPDAP
jgi:NADH-quinone oxidoreductase subunit I